MPGSRETWVGPGYAPQAGVFPFGPELSYLQKDRVEISGLSAAILASEMLTITLS